MLILRRITSENKEINIIIRGGYGPVMKESDPEEYGKLLHVFFLGSVKNDPDIYGFVTSNDGSKITPLYVKSKYFMMSERGSTFANLTLK